MNMVSLGGAIILLTIIAGAAHIVPSLVAPVTGINIAGISAQLVAGIATLYYVYTKEF